VGQFALVPPGSRYPTATRPPISTNLILAYSAQRPFKLKVVPGSDGRLSLVISSDASRHMISAEIVIDGGIMAGSVRRG
jgi:hypothetical protein